MENIIQGELITTKYVLQTHCKIENFFAQDFCFSLCKLTNGGVCFSSIERDFLEQQYKDVCYHALQSSSATVYKCPEEILQYATLMSKGYRIKGCNLWEAHDYILDALHYNLPRYNRRFDVFLDTEEAESPSVVSLYRIAQNAVQISFESIRTNFYLDANQLVLGLTRGTEAL